MKILLWIGNEANQRALANKIHAVLPLAGIVTESRINKTKITFKMLLVKGIEKIFLSIIGKAWWGMKKHYDNLYPLYPCAERLDVENINSDEAYEFSKRLDCDLILVSGTRMIKEKMLSLKPGIGILNLHTGLSPYIKGGPNCTNWCIATQQFHLIGNTVMWIDAGIDTGNILTTEFTNLAAGQNLAEIHIAVMDHAHLLYTKAIEYLQSGRHKSIPQASIAKGKTYYTKAWNIRKEISLMVNLKRLKSELQSGKVIRDRVSIKTITLEQP